MIPNYDNLNNCINVLNTLVLLLTQWVFDNRFFLFINSMFKFRFYVNATTY